MQHPVHTKDPHNPHKVFSGYLTISETQSKFTTGLNTLPNQEYGVIHVNPAVNLKHLLVLRIFMVVNGDCVFFPLRNTAVGREEEGVMANTCQRGAEHWVLTSQSILLKLFHHPQQTNQVQSKQEIGNDFIIVDCKALYWLL